MKKHETNKAGSLSQHIKHWAESNDWYHTDIQTNQLRLEQHIGLAIEAIAKDLDYQNQTQLRRQVLDCYNKLMAMCLQIDMVCRMGCRSNQELFELRCLKSKAVGAAAELTDVLGILQITHDISNLNRVAATDHREVDGRHTVSPIDLGIASVAATLCGNDTLAYSGQTNNEWMTFSEVAEVIGVTKGTISKWASEGKFQDNGQKGQKRRLLKTSVLMVKHEKESEDLKKDAWELRRDTGKLA